MILVFDLDSTLYDESSYVSSGLRAVARHLKETFNLEENEVYDHMEKILAEQGRGKIFDEVLQAHQKLSRKNIRKCLSVYRLHTPELSLSPDAERCLERFSDQNMYVVTDGNKIVQSKKARALGLDNKVKRIFITHRYGRHNAKPSTFCFKKIAKIENVPSNMVVYIGDDPRKDFVNLKPAGFKTVRILKGPYKDLRADSQYDALISIESLDELDDVLLSKLEND